MVEANALDEEIRCIGCDYCLRGLAAADGCPECGEPVEPSLEYHRRPIDMKRLTAAHRSAMCLLGGHICALGCGFTAYSAVTFFSLLGYVLGSFTWVVSGTSVYLAGCNDPKRRRWLYLCYILSVSPVFPLGWLWFDSLGMIRSTHWHLMLAAGASAAASWLLYRSLADAAYDAKRIHLSRSLRIAGWCLGLATLLSVLGFHLVVGKMWLVRFLLLGERPGLPGVATMPLLFRALAHFTWRMLGLWQTWLLLLVPVATCYVLLTLIRCRSDLDPAAVAHANPAALAEVPASSAI